MDHEHIEAFFTETTNAFHFLKTEYGYQLLERVTQDLKYFQDAAASVRYVSALVGITVGWGFADGIIGVGFTELLQSGCSLFPAAYFLSGTVPIPQKELVCIHWQQCRVMVMTLIFCSKRFIAPEQQTGEYK